MTKPEFTGQYPELTEEYFEAREQAMRDMAQEQLDFEQEQWHAFEEAQRDSMHHLIMGDIEGFLL